VRLSPNQNEAKRLLESITLTPKARRKAKPIPLDIDSRTVQVVRILRVPATSPRIISTSYWGSTIHVMLQLA
jgi:hypothetical protein